ncbi:MAG: 4-(cytidine 5'-diphospho)-2-C-methyl-D-erythritol kinase [Gemmataceae bacterium]
MRVWTPAKVNLFLEVLGRRPDGYHDLATLMVTVGLFDTLELRPAASGAVTLHCDHPGLSTGADNLVCRAARLMRDRFGVGAGVDLRLTKRIPLAAGLAGGSSDAAATLAGLNRLWRLGLDDATLGRLGAELGSDVTFFFSAPAAWCTGRGEIVAPTPIGRPLYLVLACPPVGLSTASVFGALTLPDRPVDGEPIRRALADGDVTELGRLLFNRLEEPAMRLCPEVARLRARLAELGPAGVLMSGSGSTVFALAADADHAECLSRALTAVKEDGVRICVLVVRSCD